MLQTIQKASEVLALYDQSHTEWGVHELASRLHLAKSSAHDLLSSLAQVGFLQKTETGRYRLGWRLVAMSDTLLSSTELCREARPILENLAAQYRETIHLAVLNDTKIVYIDVLQSKQPVRVELSSIGEQLAPHGSAVGNKKALDLEVWDSQTGGDKPILTSLASGSQRFRIAISVALGIGQYIGRDSNRIESVIIDEGFGSLDREGRESIIQELYNLRQHLKRIILVSHQEEYARGFSTGYEINLVDGASQVKPLAR